MKKQVILKKKELAFAVGMALFAGAMSGCSSSDDGVVGNKTINTAGGNGGVEGYAGDGGYIDVYNYGGLGGVHVKRTGKADTAFTSQKNKITPFLGMNPLEITSDTTIPVVTSYTAIGDGVAVTAGDLYISSVLADGILRTAAGIVTASGTDVAVTDGSLYIWSAMPNELYTAVGDDATADLAAAGTPYMPDGDNYIYTADEDDTTPDPDVTGLSVAAGKTLTMGLNYNGYVSYLYFDNDVVNHGTITTADANVTDRGDMWWYPSSFISDGTVDTSGSGTVVNGGDLYIESDYASINASLMDSSGADNAAGDGGDSGYIYLYGNRYTENTGTLNANAGNATGAGNDGGDVDSSGVYIYTSGYGSTFNSGDITAMGGDGEIGGDGAWVGIYNEIGGKVLNSGDINTSGGTGSAGNGGDAGDVDIYGYGGNVASSGNITARGGDAALDFDAGDGGDLYLYGEPGDNSNGWADGSLQNNIDLSGDIDLDGGSASGTGSGGDGGDFDIYLDNYGTGSVYVTSDAAITLHGYSTLNTSGGDAAFPGSGDDVDLYASYGYIEVPSDYTSGGSVSNAADIIASAGALTGTLDTGTYRIEGGDVNIETSYYAYLGYITAEMTATNTGNITSNGGDGRNATNDGRLAAGDVIIWGYKGLSNTGNITVNGGNDLAADAGTDGVGGTSGSVMLYAEVGSAINTGTITANGGNGEYRGGDGSDWTAMFAPVVEAGKITGKGGDAVATVPNYSPGYGGWVWLNGTVSTKASSVSLIPGAGYTTVNPDMYGYYKVVGPHCEGDCN